MINDFGAIAKEKRQQLGLTLKQVADKACCSFQTVWETENNKRNAKMDTLLSIYQVLGIEIEVKG